MNSYPDLSWTQFLQCCTGDPRLQFEEMCRRLFIAEYLHGKELPQAETSHPGIEVDPVLADSGGQVLLTGYSDPYCAFDRG